MRVGRQHSVHRWYTGEQAGSCNRKMGLLVRRRGCRSGSMHSSMRQGRAVLRNLVVDDGVQQQFITNKKLRALHRAWTSGATVRTLLLSVRCCTWMVNCIFHRLAVSCVVTGVFQWNQSMGPKGLNTLGALLSGNSSLRRVELAVRIVVARGSRSLKQLL